VAVALFDPLLDWFVVGPLLGRRGLGLLIFAVALAYGAATGNVTAVAQILAGGFWRKGLQGTALALAAGAVAARSGRRTRRLTPEEYEWAQQEVFGGGLPPRHRILLTDTAGVDGRAFTFPQPDGSITVNLGPDAYAEPLAQPALLLHELTHVWQIAHQPVRTLWMAAAVAAQAADLVTHRAYEVPPPGRPFARFNPEQQAMIVEHWWVGGRRETDPYFRYIEGNIRSARR
jgi:hypothetical protein